MMNVKFMPLPMVSCSFDFLKKFTEETWHGSSHRNPLNVSSLLCAVYGLHSIDPRTNSRRTHYKPWLVYTGNAATNMVQNKQTSCLSFLKERHYLQKTWTYSYSVQILNQVFKLALEAIKRVCYNGPCHWYYKTSVWKTGLTVFFFLHSLPLQCYRKCYFNKTKTNPIII